MVVPVPVAASHAHPAPILGTARTPAPHASRATPAQARATERDASSVARPTRCSRPHAAPSVQRGQRQESLHTRAPTARRGASPPSLAPRTARRACRASTAWWARRRARSAPPAPGAWAAPAGSRARSAPARGADRSCAWPAQSGATASWGQAASTGAGRRGLRAPRAPRGGTISASPWPHEQSSGLAEVSPTFCDPDADVCAVEQVHEQLRGDRGGRRLPRLPRRALLPGRHRQATVCPRQLQRAAEAGLVPALCSGKDLPRLAGRARTVPSLGQKYGDQTSVLTEIYYHTSEAESTAAQVRAQRVQELPRRTVLVQRVGGLRGLPRGLPLPGRRGQAAVHARLLCGAERGRLPGLHARPVHGCRHESGPVLDGVPAVSRRLPVLQPPLPRGVGGDRHLARGVRARLVCPAGLGSVRAVPQGPVLRTRRSDVRGLRGGVLLPREIDYR
eukprot:COSAG01_NODE_310_length_19129_cov_22.110615_4_plen_449_part_00